MTRERDPFDELLDLVRESGAVMTFDSRRYARAALSWPDYLPPMFGEANAAVERWGMDGFSGMWVPRAPDAWPAPTVRVGEAWEQKSARMPTWEMAESLPPESIYRCSRHRVVRVAGERFVNERGHSIPWAKIPGSHWRLIQAAGDEP